MTEKDLIKELKDLRAKRESDARVKSLKKQIKAEHFAQTKSGKVFNKIADVGDASGRAIKKFLSPQQIAEGTRQHVQKRGKAGTKKIKSTVKSVEQVMADMEKSVNQFG